MDAIPGDQGSMSYIIQEWKSSPRDCTGITTIMNGKHPLVVSELGDNSDPRTPFKY